MRWPTWTYGALGAGYAVAAGFSAIYAAPLFMSPPELEFDDLPRNAQATVRMWLSCRTGRKSKTCAKIAMCACDVHDHTLKVLPRATRLRGLNKLSRDGMVQEQRRERKPDMGRLILVAAAVAKNPTFDGTVTYSAVLHPAPAAAGSPTVVLDASNAAGDAAAGVQTGGGTLADRNTSTEGPTPSGVYDKEASTAAAADRREATGLAVSEMPAAASSSAATHEWSAAMGDRGGGGAERDLNYDEV